MLSELRDPVQKRKIIDYIKHHEIHCADFILAGTSNNLPGVGKRLGEIATGMNCTSEEAALYLLEHGGSEVLIFDQNINPASIEQLLKHSLSLIATDGAGFPLPEEAIFDSKHDLVHPRCYGTAPTFLEMVHTKKIMSIESAIQKLTKTPADILGIKNSGVLKVGLEADIAVYNPDTISSGATLQNPFQQSTGIEHVLIHGESVIFDGRMQNAQPGRFITT
jgi:N-acyl-D-amino-acid deacylase